MNRFLAAFTFLIPTLCFSITQWDGDYYKENSGLQYGAASAALKQFPIPKNAAVLDIGSGDGRISKYIASFVPQGYVIGIDQSQSMVATAQAYKSPTLSFIQADAAQLPFSNRFDRVVSFNCLHWVIDIKGALISIRQALVEGGQALFVVAPIQPRSPVHKVMEDVAKSAKWRQYFNTSKLFNLYSMTQWANLVEEAGLITENLQFIDTSLDYTNKIAFSEWLSGWVPFGTIPEDLKKAFVNDLVAAYTAAVPCEANGTVHFKLEELIIVASKPKN